MTDTRKTLHLRFHGKIIDHLGIQMYQSPTAAIAELIANAWDADASAVQIDLPSAADTTFTIKDDGSGMTFEECEERFLNVGYCRRHAPDEKSPGGRPILGRKGIGKFAGFGIAQIIRVDTVSRETGERTKFELDVNSLRQGEYIERGGEIEVVEYLGPNARRSIKHGTAITLTNLTIANRPLEASFIRSMARRFQLRQWASDFRVLVNGRSLPETERMQSIQFSFPQDYREDERPSALTLEDGGWGREFLANGREIKWRIHFFKEPIDDEELRGVAVFANVKLAQKPFFFNLAGGLGGQHGQQYLSGQVQADYVDLLGSDLIATERQRINWDDPEAAPLLDWGQKRVAELLRIWQDRRGEIRKREIEERLTAFARRMGRLPKHEARVVNSALTKLGGIPSLSDAQFQELGGAVLTAWEQGRLKTLIDDISRLQHPSAESLLSLLAEAEILVALGLAEVINTKLEAIRGLKRMVDRGDLENRLRDYIAERPYLLHPRWETYKKEISLRKILEEAADRAKLSAYGNKRIDLALRSGSTLLVVEFMRPGVSADYDHLARCRAYLHIIREKVGANTASNIITVEGLIVADGLDSKKPEIRREIQDLKKTDIFAHSWAALLAESEQVWADFLQLVGDRAPRDERVRRLASRTIRKRSAKRRSVRKA